MFDNLGISLLIGGMILCFCVSVVLSVLVILKYKKSLKRIPKEVVDISRDGYIYKIANGEVLSVFKMKKRLLRGYVYWYQTKDNLIKYETLIAKINAVASGTEKFDFVPEPYWKNKKFKVEF